MKIKILKKSRWAQGPDKPQLQFNEGDVVEINDEVLVQSMINAEYAIELKNDSNQSDEDAEWVDEKAEESPTEVETMAENKMKNPDYEKKSSESKPSKKGEKK